ncbi:AbrB/MazE/SpoVT family DNA-binding domain-containing protein [Haladaptatus sp. AB643]|uniref:AbrB/MazE/SpoVT family DNA-binding domain-containing protein n=1 Tax=Haladaptatus sp. AB643 TaxID=2934174 RepID=UPI00209BEE5D|nr:AbrB/MazE/SpoVT family DNA-binding domain-containing protein [Haladaptatus sp. AB643]MCO8243117.1 AbrB/MazE/SpoVT family DNA-binding domain-containing protein [Haladaptatus sp. AB643]
MVNMGIKQRFADTRTAQEGNNVIQLTVPKDIPDELGITGGDEVLWTGEENTDKAEIHAPQKKQS